jgi:hypothetical protein
MHYLCVNVYCTTATGCQPNCSWQIYNISYHYPQNRGLSCATEPVWAFWREKSVVATGIQNLDAPTYSLIAILTMLTTHQYFTALPITTTELLLLDRTVKWKVPLVPVNRYLITQYQISQLLLYPKYSIVAVKLHLQKFFLSNLWWIHHEVFFVSTCLQFINNFIQNPKWASRSRCKEIYHTLSALVS